MAFRLRRDAKIWFKDLYETKEFTVDFDALYFCFMAAILTSRRAPEAPAADTSELVDYFPGRYGERKQLLVATLLTAELKRLSVNMDNKEEIHATIGKLIHPNSPSQLSEEGVREFNRYAYSGYDVLKEWFEDRPRFLHTFLREFEAQVVALGETN